MKLLARSLYFWIATVLLVVAVGGATLWFLPPLLKQFKENSDKIAALDSQIAENEQFLATLQGIEKQSTTLDALNDKAQLSLPKDPQPEILILQLDGLLKSLNLNKVTIEVPLTATVAKNAPAGLAVTKFTLTGKMSFAQAKELIANLRGLSRWNKLTALDLSQSEAVTTVTISGESYSKAGQPKAFTGSKSFLANASKLFDSLTPYTTIPNVKTEGTFGKDDPFTN
jgi:hypothetical protein